MTMTSEMENVLKGSLVRTATADKAIGVSSANLTPDQSGVEPLSKQSAFETVSTQELAAPASDALAPVAQTLEAPAPEALAPVAQTLEAPAPEALAPVAQTLEAPAPEALAPVAQALEAPAPEALAPVAQTLESPAPEALAPVATAITAPASDTLASTTTFPPAAEVGDTITEVPVTVAAPTELGGVDLGKLMPEMPPLGVKSEEGVPAEAVETLDAPVELPETTEEVVAAEPTEVKADLFVDGAPKLESPAPDALVPTTTLAPEEASKGLNDMNDEKENPMLVDDNSLEMATEILKRLNEMSSSLVVLPEIIESLKSISNPNELLTKIAEMEQTLKEIKFMLGEIKNKSVEDNKLGTVAPKLEAPALDALASVEPVVGAPTQEPFMQKVSDMGTTTLQVPDSDALVQGTQVVGTSTMASPEVSPFTLGSANLTGNASQGAPGVIESPMLEVPSVGSGPMLEVPTVSGEPAFGAPSSEPMLEVPGGTSTTVQQSEEMVDALSQLPGLEPMVVDDTHIKSGMFV